MTATHGRNPTQTHMSPDNPEHLKTLQSLRGLAALTVLIHHCFRLVAGADNAWFVSEHILNGQYR